MSAYLTPAEVADLLNIGRSTVYRAINKGELIAYRVGGYKIKPEDIDQWMKRKLARLPQTGLADSEIYKPKDEQVLDFAELIEPIKGAA